MIPNYPDSNSRPDLVAVVYTELDLTVDFKHKILKGIALLALSKIKCECDELILDTDSLEIINVKEYCTNIPLDYNMQYCDKLIGNKLIIKIPTDPIENRSTQLIEIEYKTRPDSLALYWLIEEQTSFTSILIANTEFIYTRAIFPCQDTPSHRASYRMQIYVPGEFLVISSTCGQKLCYNKNLNLFVFHYHNIPSCALPFVIASKDIWYEIKKYVEVWIEKKYFYRTKLMLETYLKKELSYYEFFIFMLEYMFLNLYINVNKKIWKQMKNIFLEMDKCIF